MTQASHKIKQVEAGVRDPRGNRIREQHAVQADLQTGAGESVRQSRT